MCTGESITERETERTREKAPTVAPNPLDMVGHVAGGAGTGGGTDGARGTRGAHPRPGPGLHRRVSTFTPLKLVLQSMCRSQLPHESVNLSSTMTDMNNKLTDLWGN